LKEIIVILKPFEDASNDFQADFENSWKCHTSIFGFDESSLPDNQRQKWIADYQSYYYILDYQSY
jgi:hypothetical protein